MSGKRILYPVQALLYDVVTWSIGPSASARYVIEIDQASAAGAAAPGLLKVGEPLMMLRLDG